MNQQAPNNQPMVNSPGPAKAPMYYAVKFGQIVKALLTICFWSALGLIGIGALVVVGKAVIFFVQAALTALGIS